MATVYLNGSFIQDTEARVSALDRGFLFGDGVYEVIPAYGGRLFRLQEHLQRLHNSLQGIRMQDPLPNHEWQQVLHDLMNLNGHGQVDQSIYLQVTRGAYGRREHTFPADVQATVFAMCSPLASVGTVQPVAAITREDIRWARCDIKAVTLLANALLKQEAADAGAFETILIRDGRVIEGAASNVFVVSNGQVATAPKNHEVLPGITRDLVVELLAQTDRPCQEREIPVDELAHADEIWITSSTKEIVPVIRLDDRQVGCGQAGPVWQATSALYRDFKQQFREGRLA